MIEFLNSHGHEVYVAEDVLSCLDILIDTVPDLIFLDLIMPHICGDDLCRINRSIDYLENC
ncbi:MAG: response regulator [Desulfobulbaceae bacterium]|nr:MAG: response regulator [Desulfobulbaceae bacterium]